MEYCARGQVERTVQHEVKPSAALLSKPSSLSAVFQAQQEPTMLLM